MNVIEKIGLFLLILTFCSTGCKDTEMVSQEADQAQLDAQYAEILKLSTQYSCENSGEWKFTAYGSQACGGPVGYIAYSVKINEQDFMAKVKAFGENQVAFNKKYGVFSTCAIIVPPKNIICENSKPKFVYQ